MHDELDNLKKEFEKTIEKFAEKYNIDLAYLGIKIDVTTYDENFEKFEVDTLIDTNKETYCTFCGKKTYFYDKDHDMHLCAKCWSDMNSKKE